MEEKSDIQAVVDLLEANGYHVFKAEEEMISPGNPSGAINLQIAPRERLSNPSCHIQHNQ
jgi:hypothetical protein